MRTRDELAMALRHVRGRKRLVQMQEALVDKLRASGHPSEQAVELLKTFNTTLDLRKDHLRVIKGEIAQEAHVFANAEGHHGPRQTQLGS